MGSIESNLENFLDTKKERNDSIKKIGGNYFCDKNGAICYYDNGNFKRVKHSSGKQIKENDIKEVIGGGILLITKNGDYYSKGDYMTVVAKYEIDA